MQNAHRNWLLLKNFIVQKFVLEADIVQITGKLIDKTFLIAKPINPNPFFGKKKSWKVQMCAFSERRKKKFKATWHHKNGVQHT